MDIGLAKSHCRESHDFMTCTVSHTLTSWVLISPLSQKVLELWLVSKFNRYSRLLITRTFKGNQKKVI